MLVIKKINQDIQKEWQFLTNMPIDENGLTNPLHGVSQKDYEETEMPKLLNYEKGIGMPDWMVPETFLYLWNDDEIVGQFRIRHYLNDTLREGAGHIGYFIGKEFRGKGYATEGLKQTLDIARTIIPEDEIYLRVNKDNPASLKVMKNNGGRVVAESEDKYFVRISK